VGRRPEAGSVVAATEVTVASFCALCGSTDLVGIGNDLGICLDARECHRRQAARVVAKWERLGGLQASNADRADISSWAVHVLRLIAADAPVRLGWRYARPFRAPCPLQLGVGHAAVAVR
jgi:hypothetical protein